MHAGDYNRVVHKTSQPSTPPQKTLLKKATLNVLHMELLPNQALLWVKIKWWVMQTADLLAIKTTLLRVCSQGWWCFAGSSSLTPQRNPANNHFQQPYFQGCLLVLCAGLLPPYTKPLHELQKSHILNAILSIARHSWKWSILKFGFFHHADFFGITEMLQIFTTSLLKRIVTNGRRIGYRRVLSCLRQPCYGCW